MRVCDNKSPCDQGSTLNETHWCVESKSSESCNSFHPTKTETKTQDLLYTYLPEVKIRLKGHLFLQLGILSVDTELTHLYVWSRQGLFQGLVQGIFRHPNLHCKSLHSDEPSEEFRFLALPSEKAILTTVLLHLTVALSWSKLLQHLEGCCRIRLASCPFGSS